MSLKGDRFFKAVPTSTRKNSRTKTNDTNSLWRATASQMDPGRILSQFDAK